MQLILFDGHSWENLLPLTFTRPVGALRVGILTIAEKWEHELQMEPSYFTQPYLQVKYPAKQEGMNLLVNGSLLPDDLLVQSIRSLQAGESLVKEGSLLAWVTSDFPGDLDASAWGGNSSEYGGKVSRVDYPWKIFNLNGQEIAADMARITKGKEGASLSKTVRVLHPENVFVEPGFRGEHFTLNASEGPVYLGKAGEIMEGCSIRGPFALCEGSVVKMGAKIYGPTTLGPYSKVGGEINNAVLQANSNKAHDGFLGNAVLGEWCNLGADTNNSNLKNNYAEVKIWNYPQRKFIRTGTQFCGLIMGDHSKCGINTMFNTGTVVGVSANIFGSGFPRNFIPSFSWGGAAGFTTYKMEKVVETARLVMERRGMELTDTDLDILQYIFDLTEEYRKWN